MTNNGEWFGALAVVTAIPAAVTALLLERRRKENHPGTLPFAWGMYFGLNILFIGVIIGGLGLRFLLDEPSGGASLAILGALYVASGYFAVKRSRAGMIASTILSLNLVWWIANTIYIRNRWEELRGAKSRLLKPSHQLDAMRIR